jgi:predicted RNase H-like nuclease (RuvC/YqgF family)
MNILKKALTPFVEFEEKPAPLAKQQAPTSPQGQMQPQTVYVPKVSSSTSEKFTSEEIAKFEAHFDKLLSDANLPGPDYYEYLKVEENLEKAIPDEKVRSAAAFASLGVQGLTKDTLISSANQYIEVIKKDREGFEAALKEKQKTEIESRKGQIATLQLKIQQITQEIATSQKTIDTLTEEIEQTQSKIQKNEGAYLAACDAMIGKIESDIQKAQTL